MSIKFKPGDILRAPGNPHTYQVIKYENGYIYGFNTSYPYNKFQFSNNIKWYLCPEYQFLEQFNTDLRELINAKA